MKVACFFFCWLPLPVALCQIVLFEMGGNWLGVWSMGVGVACSAEHFIAFRFFPSVEASLKLQQRM